MTIKDRLKAFWRFMSSPRPPSEITAGESMKSSNAPRYVAEYEYSEDGDIVGIEGKGHQFKNEPIPWMETTELPDGTRIGKSGALWFVLADDDSPISLGYHNIRLRNDVSGYVGEIGGHREIFDPEPENENGN